MARVPNFVRSEQMALIMVNYECVSEDAKAFHTTNYNPIVQYHIHIWFIRYYCAINIMKDIHKDTEIFWSYRS